MLIGVPQETFPGERRVAIVPASIKPLAKLGCEVLVESGAGSAAGFGDETYVDAGARIALSRDEVFRAADVIVQVRLVADAAGVGRLIRGKTVVAQCDPLSDPPGMAELAKSDATVFALELLPRITRAQSMDVLSSMATIAGYKAVLLAANHLPQMFPMLMTAAGTLTPAKVFVVGAGVAGLQAIATSRKLGAVVQAYDVRPTVKEQVESLGAKFVEMDLAASEGTGGYAKEMGEDFYRRQRELMHKVVAGCDVVITTAMIPGKKSPVLITADMVRAMPAGSVIVDLAAERGGNCELTKPGETVAIVRREGAGVSGQGSGKSPPAAADGWGVTILGPLNLAAEVPRHASQMYSSNIAAFLKPLVKEGRLVLDLKDEVVAGTLVCQGGELMHPVLRQLARLPELKLAAEPAPAEPPHTIKLAGDE
jgi:NAD(P) transhydrogenase subunit alpha